MSSVKVNGYGPAVADHKAQAEFYDQWLRLKDAVLTDKHPHFKLPASVKERLQPATAPTPPSTFGGSVSQLPGLSNGLSGARAPSGVQNGSGAGLANAQAYAQNASTTTGAIASKSGIDPILLTKSDELRRAEIHLKRQRIERQLKDAWDQRKQGSRYRENEDAAPLFALTEILHKALETVKPISGLAPPANAETAASDSFDENSYYSSQVNDWSSEEGSPKNKLAGAGPQKATGPASSASLYKNRPSEIEHLDKQPRSPLQILDRNETEAVYDAEREDSEEYSPPAADAFSGPDGDADAMDLDDDSSEFVPQDVEVPSPHVPIITSRLTQLAAPQPAHVSPLTVATAPGLDRSQDNHHPAPRDYAPASPRVHPPIYSYQQQVISDESTTSLRGSAQTSPAGLTRRQKNKNKKRKREAEAQAATKARKPRNKNKSAVSSPEPYIKPEPVSPPPFAGPTNTQPTPTRPYQLPPDVEIVPAPRPTYYQEPPPSATLQYGSDGVSSPTVIRVASPAAYARPGRDSQDLRRVASLHAAQRPVSPTARAYSPAAYRTVSQPYAGASSRYAQEPTRAPQPQYIRSERSVTPPHLRAAREPHMQVMAPPPPPSRRIVVDQYGNRYYASESEPQPRPQPYPQHRMSVAPQLRPEPEILYERAPSRQSVVYASHSSQSVYDDGNGAVMLPPPPPPVRRAIEQPEATPAEYRVYRQREYSRAPEPQYYREEPVYVREAPAPRASVYSSEPVSAGPYMPRAYSVQPEAEPVRYMSRQPSVAPQTEYVRVADSGNHALPPPSMRAASVVPGADYGQPAEVRYAYGQPGGQYAAPEPRHVPEGTAGMSREVYVDQYGRVLR